LRDWPVSGTVGYEFLNDVCALFVDPAGEAPLTALWERIAADSRSFGEVAFEAKVEQALGTFRPEVQRLGSELGQVEIPGELDGLAEALAALAVYRTYVDPLARRVEVQDRRAIADAEMAPELAEILALERPAPAAFITRFQQTTPAIMAKGVEDTAFYRYGRLLALNDVGGDPSRFGIDVEHFHAGCVERAQRFPLNLLTTMTHDAKRSGDVRARIGALASMPEEWAAHVERWLAVTEPLRDGAAPDEIERYFLLQTLVGAWPIELERIQAYMVKALREAKRHTNWVQQNHDYEDAVRRFCGAVYADRALIAEFEPFAARVAAAGDRAALGQLVLKLTTPGVPDVYQGDELPYRALVDPDNRRPVDWAWHQAMLRRLMGGSPPIAETRKLFLILRLLGLRARRPEAFLGGAHEPLDAGAGACVFVRGGEVLVAVALPRAGADPDAVIDAPGGRWRDVLRGEERSFGARQPLARLLDTQGIGVFERLGAN
jgi:(1->4)-alpha-D-glucan 1-alpha-D-glucosylmutase